MIAYFLLVHRYPSQFKRLFKAIYSTSNHYLIHIDKESSTTIHNDIQNFVKKCPNVTFLTSQNVIWGGYSMVDVELNGIKKLLAMNVKWDHYINLSGQDFPLHNQQYIGNFLASSNNVDFIKIENQVTERPNTLNRIKSFFVEGQTGFKGRPISRSYLANVTPYIGGQWKILSRKCCEFITHTPQVNKFINYYKNTLIPDESFFQTVLMNTSYDNTIINDDKRAIIWIPDLALAQLKMNLSLQDTNSLIASGTIKLRPKDFTIMDKSFLQNTTALFARKFDESLSVDILDYLEASLYKVSAKVALAS